MKRGFSIITVSKGRLEHLKQSLPRMLGQRAAEVIVVDFSCPQGTGDYVAEHFPAARVVKVEGETHFSNWKARNAGAAAATSEILVFCDADTILADGAVKWLDSHFPPRSFGYFERGAMEGFNRKGLKLGKNQLRGFLVVAAKAFRRVGGYDELFEGYAAGADTDLVDRLGLIGHAEFRLDSDIIADVIEHGNAERLEHHREPTRISYGAGFIYRTAKFALLKIKRMTELPLEVRRELYDSAHQAAANLGSSTDSVSLTVAITDRKVKMPRQLGYAEAAVKTSLRVEVSGKNRIEKIPD